MQVQKYTTVQKSANLAKNLIIGLGNIQMLGGWNFFFFYRVYSVSLEFSKLISALKEGAHEKLLCVQSKLYEGNRVLTFDMKTLLDISGFQDGISPASVRPGFSKSKPCVVLFSHVIHLTTQSPGSVKRQVI